MGVVGAVVSQRQERLGKMEGGNADGLRRLGERGERQHDDWEKG
jgi:hypothetical protein